MKQGYITEIKHDPAGRFGPSWQMYIDGSSMGFSKTAYKGFDVGDFVEYDTVQKGNYENLKPGSLSKITPPAGSVAPARPQPSTIALDRQDVISRQAALNSAVSFISVLQAAGALPEGKSLTADKKADKLKAILMSYVKEFYELNTNSPYTVDEEMASRDVAANWDEQE